MLLQTNSYIVPKDKRSEHARLMRRFRQTLGKLGCDQFEIYEQVGANWNGTDTSGRFVQLMRFRDRKHQLAVQNAERSDPAAQALITEFCELVNFPYQQQQGYFAVGFYTSVVGNVAPRASDGANAAPETAGAEVAEAPVEEFDSNTEAEPSLMDAEAPADEAEPWADEEMAATQAEAGSPAGHSAEPPNEVLNFDEPGEPLSEEELEQQLVEETPPPTPPPAPPASRTGLFRRK